MTVLYKRVIKCPHPITKHLPKGLNCNDLYDVGPPMKSTNMLAVIHLYYCIVNDVRIGV